MEIPSWIVFGFSILSSFTFCSLLNMPCKQCEKEHDGKFLVFNVYAALMDGTKTWVNPPKNEEVDLSLKVTKYHQITELFQGQEFECDLEAPKEVDIFSKMCNHNNCSELGDKQAEEYFCSKECLIKWFTNIIETLP